MDPEKQIVVSEDVEKIIAFTILIFLYISIPVLSVFLLLFTFLELRYIFNIVLDRNFVDLGNAILVFILIIVLIWMLKRVLRWLNH